MSSPFRYFRKHTKVFLAVAAVLAIFIFVVGDALNSAGGAGGDGRGATATVATWNGGSLNEGQLGSLVAQRLLVDEFLKRLFVQGGGQTGYDFPSSIPPLLLNSQEMEQIETDVIGTEVVSSLATQAGMTVSDAVINHYIEEMGLNKVSGDEVVSILKSIGQHNARANEAIVFNMLKKMLLAHFYRRTYADASMVVLPQQRWDDWRKVNERISVEAAVLPVEKFISEVPDPSDAQLMAYYEEHKEADPGRHENVGGRELPLPAPGFAVPRRVKLQYLLGDVEPRAEQLREKVTEEEIKDYYERNKRLEFTKMDLPGADAFGAPATEAPTTPSTETDDAVEPPTERAADDEAPATTENPAATGTAPAEPADSPEVTTEEPAATTPPPADSTEPAAEPATDDDDGETSSGIRTSSPFRLAAFQTPPAETDEQAEADQGKGADETEGADAGDTVDSTDTATEGKAAADAAPADDAAQTAPAATEDAADAAAATTPETGAAADPAAATEEEAVEYEPLENVRDEIRQRLATDKAVEELERVMNDAAAQLQLEYTQYGSQVAEAKELKKKPPQPPAKLLDLKWLADQHGLTYEKTTPLTIRELYDTAVGKAGDAATQRVSVTQAAYQSLELYEPMLARELEGDWYLVMKTGDTPRRVPEFKEVRDQVAEAWKRAEAAKLAEKKAKELAGEVTKSGAPFDQFFFAERGFEVVKPTAFFSWRSYPVGRAGAGTPPGLSDVPELKNVGPEFMDTAFNLQDKEAAGLLNYDNSAAYVIRLDRRQYTEEELRKLFLEEEGAWPGRMDMLNEHYSMFNSAVEKEILEERAGLEFDEEWLERRAERMQQRQN